jgi:hypothetical protein
MSQRQRVVCAARLPPEEAKRFLADLQRASEISFAAWQRYRDITGQPIPRRRGRPRKNKTEEEIVK